MNVETKNLLEGLNPVTQTTDSGKALAKFLGMKEELPEIIALVNGALLTLSSKKDCYYYTSEKGCTCKAGQYGRNCKHKKALEGSKPRGQSLAQTLEEHDRNLSKMPYQYRRMVQAAREEAEAEPAELINRGGFRPVMPEDEERAVSSMLIDAYAPVTTEGEIAYWAKKMEA
jgi:hypothetical protein